MKIRIAHARLKDHVASMSGGLEARVNEGGKLLRYFSLPNRLCFAMHPSAAALLP